MAAVVSVNVAKPATVIYAGRRITTAIMKKPAAGRIALGNSGLEGDGQADPVNHGGRHKAVYAYASEHYEYWRERLIISRANYGLFGENLTTEGLLDEDVCIGDRLAVGGAVLCITQPRIPCYKLCMVIGRRDFIEIFGRSARLGFYMRVVGEGAIAAGDRIEIASRDPERISIRDIAALYFVDTENYREMARVVQHRELPEGIAKVFRHRLAQSGKLFT